MSEGPSFDIAQEQQPNPAWLRQLANTLRHESELLTGHFGTLLDASLTDDSRGRVMAQRLACAVSASTMLGCARDALCSLADAMDVPDAESPPPAYLRLVAEQRAAAADDARGEADR